MKVSEYVEKWKKRGYSEDIPDQAPEELESIGIVPSYRLIAKALLNNDINLLSLGGIPKKSKYYEQLKTLSAKTRA